MFGKWASWIAKAQLDFDYDSIIIFVDRSSRLVLFTIKQCFSIITRQNTKYTIYLSSITFLHRLYCDENFVINILLLAKFIYFQ